MPKDERPIPIRLAPKYFPRSSQTVDRGQEGGQFRGEWGLG